MSPVTLQSNLHSLHIEDAKASKELQSDRCPELALCHWGTERTLILLKSILYLIA